MRKKIKCSSCARPVAGKPLLHSRDPKYPLCRECESSLVAGGKTLAPTRCPACRGKKRSVEGKPPPEPCALCGGQLVVPRMTPAEIEAWRVAHAKPRKEKPGNAL